MRQLDITRIPKLSTLRLSLAHSANVQPLLDPVFASSVCLQRVIFDMRAPGECELPQTMRLKNLRCLKLGSLIRMEQLRPLIQQLPRLVELEIAVNHEPRHEILIMIDEAQRIVREQSDSTSVSLQVLGASCRRDICVSDMVSRLGAELVALLGSIKSVRRFRCRDNSRKVYDMLDRILRDPEVALVAGHLRELDVC
ncbi:hypothetical protein GGF43_004331 [Coemansia sp. RSA 2618]|nr:hypothetical protein GGF43_004331 [Coemansia sp. RSA 2618]